MNPRREIKRFTFALGDPPCARGPRRDDAAAINLADLTTDLDQAAIEALTVIARRRRRW